MTLYWEWFSGWQPAGCGHSYSHRHLSNTEAIRCSTEETLRSPMTTHGSRTRSFLGREMEVGK